MHPTVTWEGLEVQSDDEQVQPSEDLGLAQTGCIGSDQKPSTQTDISPKSSPLSESAFPKISSVYSTHSDEEYPVPDPQTNASLSVSLKRLNVSFPEQPTTQDYTVPVSTDATSSYYEARNFYANSAYPSTSYNSMFTGQSVESPLWRVEQCMLTLVLVRATSAPILQQLAKATWSAASNGMGYGFGGVQHPTCTNIKPKQLPTSKWLVEELPRLHSNWSHSYYASSSPITKTIIRTLSSTIYQKLLLRNYLQQPA